MANLTHYPLVIGDKLVAHGRMELTNPASGEVGLPVVSDREIETIFR